MVLDNYEIIKYLKGVPAFNEKHIEIDYSFGYACNFIFNIIFRYNFS